MSTLVINTDRGVQLFGLYEVTFRGEARPCFDSAITDITIVHADQPASQPQKAHVITVAAANQEDAVTTAMSALGTGELQLEGVALIRKVWVKT